MLTKQFFKNKRITVFGLGLNGGGVATVKFLAKCGAKEIIVTDIKKQADLEASTRILKGIKTITYVLGQHRPEDFTRTDMVIVNPGIAWTNEYVKLALSKKIPVEMDASIFFQLCPCPIIGVTGTKGKTTTASLLVSILKESGADVVPVGIGQTPVLDVLDSVSPKSVVVFELSSWRLSSLELIKKSPHVAVLTNIFPDHLNYYKNMIAYIKDKKNIFAFQNEKDWLVVNKDNDEVMQSVSSASSQRIEFSEQGVVIGNGVYVDGTDIVSVFHKNREVIASLSDIKIRGKHNVGNILAAVGGALAYGVNVKAIRKSITTFPGVEHRLEFVREKDGVKYYNDTAATVPQAAISALNSFDEPIILIAGGSNKGLEFDEYGEAIAKKAKDVVFLKGEATDRIMQSARKCLKDKEFDIVQSMEDAVKLASEKATQGDVVLLSPGATSFGLFKNEFDRGEQFRKYVKEL